MFFTKSLSYKGAVYKVCFGVTNGVKIIDYYVILLQISWIKTCSVLRNINYESPNSLKRGLWFWPITRTYPGKQNLGSQRSEVSRPSARVP